MEKIDVWISMLLPSKKKFFILVLVLKYNISQFQSINIPTFFYPNYRISVVNSPRIYWLLAGSTGFSASHNSSLPFNLLNGTIYLCLHVTPSLSVW